MQKASQALNGAAAAGDKVVQCLQQFYESMKLLLVEEAASGDAELIRRRAARLDFAHNFLGNVQKAVSLIWHSDAVKNWQQVLPLLDLWQKDYDGLVNVMLPDTRRAVNRELLESAAAAMLEFKKSLEAYIEVSRGQDTILAELRDVSALVSKIIDDVNAVALKDINVSNEEVVALGNINLLLIAGFLVASLLIAIVVAFKITTMVTRPLTEMNNAFSELVNRNFQVSFQAKT